MSANDDWLRPIERAIKEIKGRGGILLVFPEYRPDLVKAVAHRLGLRYYDYRDEQLRPLGPDAYRVGLDDLDRLLGELGESGGSVVFNVEALLATKDETERARWLAGFLSTDWPAVLMVPLTLFEPPAQDAGQVLHLDAQDLPEPSLLGRLLH